MKFFRNLFYKTFIGKIIKTFKSLSDYLKDYEYISDTFYSDVHPGTKWAKMGCMAVEMEAAGLYLNAARAGKNALSICTISDQLVTNEHLSPDDRQSGFNEMIKLALEVAISE